MIVGPDGEEARPHAAATMRELIGLAVLTAGLVGVLLLAIGGFRPRSGRSRDGRARARSVGFMRSRYRPRSRLARFLVGLPIGWAIGEVVSSAIESPLAGFGIGCVMGLSVSFVDDLAEPLAAVVGAIGLGMAIVQLYDIGDVPGINGALAFFGVIVACVVGGIVALILGERRSYVLLAMMMGVELVIFGLELTQENGGFDGPLLAVGVVAVVPATTLLVSIAPRAVLPLMGLALVATELMVALGVLGTDVTTAAMVGLATTGGYAALAALRGGSD